MKEKDHAKPHASGQNLKGKGCLHTSYLRQCVTSDMILLTKQQLSKHQTTNVGHMNNGLIDFKPCCLSLFFFSFFFFRFLYESKMTLLGTSHKYWSPKKYFHLSNGI